MPTGYTSDLYEGKDIEFPDFVMKCARAFGALIEMRDDPMDAPIPEEFKPSSYHTEQLNKAEADVVRIKSWDDTEADRQAQLAYERAQREYEEAQADKAAMRARYEAMLAKVKAWQPPTSKHQGLKDFMVKQLEESIDVDCYTTYPELPEPLTGSAYKEQQLKAARWQVSYHTEHGEDEVRRAAGRTNWVRALRQSLTESSDAAIKA